MARTWRRGEGGTGFWERKPFKITPEESLDPFDELDDQGNKPQWPRVPGRKEPPPFAFEVEPWLPPKGAPVPVDPQDEQTPWFFKPAPPQPAPAVPQPVTPENVIPPEEHEGFPGFKIPEVEIPGAGGLGDALVPVLPWAGMFGKGAEAGAPIVSGMTGLLPILVIAMIAKD